LVGPCPVKLRSDGRKTAAIKAQTRKVSLCV
jgi:hypothetical protein